MAAGQTFRASRLLTEGGLKPGPNSDWKSLVVPDGTLSGNAQNIREAYAVGLARPSPINPAALSFANNS